MKRCLSCYNTIDGSEIDFHWKCSKKIFGVTPPPELPFSEDNLQELATQIIQSQVTVTGVQPKISLHLPSTEHNSQVKRFTVVGMWGGFILKPPSLHYPQLPELEDLSMHLANIARINTVPHSLIRLQSGNLAYITRRIDRLKKSKIHMEDMCQLTGRLTENKYRGSYEQLAKALMKYSANPGLDVVNFSEIILFSFLTGNADMHFKNFSLIHHPVAGPILSPFYDLLATVLVNPEDDEELALTLNGKKRKINRNDFVTFFSSFGLERKQQENIFSKMVNSRSAWFEFINRSFLSEVMKDDYKNLIQSRMDKIYPPAVALHN